ncbi:MAG: substrate-binding domain-containing protein [Deltaproteobacteria bacterium]|jgi:molybdate/tungstate transport system substrate-binding protein|nr:substrate-binding domain-containing protein [Deltaproteobacteria bacterium]
MSEIKVFSAGVALGLANQSATIWNQAHPDSQVRLTGGGSVEGVRRHLQGDLFDLLILADEANIATTLGPHLSSGYVVFAGNKMVIAATPGSEINSATWVDKLTDPGAVFAHFNPYVDPGGYRAVLAMLLADRYQPGLSAKLLDHPGRLCLMDKPAPPKPGDKPPFHYMFAYYSMAKSRGLTFAELPEVMDLSSDSLAATYGEVEFKLNDDETVQGSPIAHALTVPLNALNPEGGRAFGRAFLENDFQAQNFLPKRKVVGTGLDPVAASVELA